MSLDAGKYETPSFGNDKRDKADDIIDLRDILLEIVRRWWLVVIFAGIGVWFGATDMHNFQPMSKAVMVVMQAGSDQQNISPVSSGNFATVSLLTGTSFGGSGQSSKFHRLVFASKSLTLARELDERHGLMNKVYGEDWAKKAVEEQSKKDRSQGWRHRVRRYLKLSTSGVPTIENLAYFIGDSLSMELISNTSFVRIEFVHRDPEMALWYLKVVYFAALEQIQRRQKANLVSRRNFLEGRLRSTDISEFRQGLIGLITKLTQEEMMVEGNVPSIAVIEPAYIVKVKTAPVALKFIGIPVLISVVLSITLILIGFLIRSEN